MNNSAASRLCSECGMCCNGVMFHSLWLQPGDSAKELAALGLKLRHKKRRHSLMQPCPAHQDCNCSIYADRPERCRIFECRQLLGLASGEITEPAALEKIREAQILVSQVRECLTAAGSKNEKKSFITRYEAALAHPIDEASDTSSAEVRQKLISAFQKLEELLKNDFRVVPVPK